MTQQSKDKLPPLEQSFFQDNRERFEAESSAITIKSLSDTKCIHQLYRKSATEIACKSCLAGWYDMGKLAI